MTALAEPRATLLRPVLSSRAWLLPALLLLPCLAWITFFFLAPLILMCWRSLASEGFSLETYSVLFTSPLFTKVMMTTVKTAGIATVFALLLAYPLAYALTISGGKVRALILVFVLIPYWVDIIVRSFSWLILLGDNGMVNKALMGLGIIGNAAAVALQSVQRAARDGANPAAADDRDLVRRHVADRSHAHHGGENPWCERMARLPHRLLPAELAGSLRRGPPGFRTCARFLRDAGAARKSA